MNIRMLPSISLYSLAIVFTVVALTVAAVTLSISKPVRDYKNVLAASQTVNRLSVRNTKANSMPVINDNGSRSASPNATTILQPSTPAPIPAGAPYPCGNCSLASSTTDLMICNSYCMPPGSEPPASLPSGPTCNICHSNTYGASSGINKCPMIACPLY